MLSPRQKSCSTSKNSRIALSLSDCLAKTYLSKDGKKCAGREVFSHCQIVGEVAREILARMPLWLREALFPRGVELIAAAHDIGKISPTFQKKIYVAINKNNVPSVLENENPDLENNWGGHGGTGQAAFSNNSKVGKYIPEIVGKHHGYTPNLGGKIATDDVLGGPEWQVQREECLAQLQSALNCFEWSKIKNYEQALVIAGLTTVADWIGSGSYFDDPKVPWQSSIQLALNNAGFAPLKLKTGLTFGDIFGFEPHSVQHELFQYAIEPGVYIMEAPMGVGKTEAALYAAYLAMCAGKATGIYFALPTQLTSDKIHERVNNFLQKILVSHHDALLLHSLAWLNKKTEMGEEGQPGGSWFEIGKRGILAPFAVGTVDQALMAVMNVKHGFVRAFGLAGKVVILDEVHSYDMYTGTILNELVRVLRELHCTVIILSATLTQERRKSLLLENNVANTSYPLITSFPRESSISEISAVPLQDNQIQLNLLNDESKALDQALLRAEQGQQVLWIENTVDEAQRVYKILASKEIKNVEYGLLHSRFLKIDREKNEAYWVKLYGKDNNEARNQQGRILVGTQVLEQSLDIDADFLITHFCPTDMLLQRLGRLWRHVNTMRPQEAVREAWILAPRLSDAIGNVEKYFGKTAKVYSPHVLIRSLEVWLGRSYIVLPKDIRSLIEATYKERDEVVDVIGRLKYDLQTKRGNMERFALNSVSKSTQTEPDNKASTRYSEQDNVEVLLIRSYRYNEDKSGTYVMLLNDEEIYLPRNTKKLSKQEWREIAALLTRNTLHVVERLAPDAILSTNLTWLKNYLYIGNKEYHEALLRVAIVKDSGELQAIAHGAAAKKHRLSYDAKLGYRVEK